MSKIYLGKLDYLELGNIYASRDWGYAKEYVQGMHKMLQADFPDDYVLATNKTYTIKEFVNKSFQSVDMEIKWEGKGIEEVGIDKKTGRKVVLVNEKYFRPSEVEYLYGDYSKAQKILGWEPKTDISELVELMVKADLKRNG